VIRRWRDSDSTMAGVAALVVALAMTATGCTDDTDPPWQLDHDRIIAVRATPPQIAAGEQAVIDGLLGEKGAPAAERSPERVIVVSPASLSTTLATDGSRWLVTSPDATQLAAARSELGLASDALVPLVIDASYASGKFHAIKTVWLGDQAQNPAMAGIQINNVTPTEAEIVIAPDVDVPLSINLSDVDYDVTWLSSCGTMHDFDLPTARLRVEKNDPTSGQLAIVVRDARGGVNWQIWAIRAGGP
jgi:hypothetical protein